MLKSDFYFSLLDRFSIVAITDKAGRIIYSNDNFCKISKYTEAELLGQNHRIVSSGYHPKSFFINLWKTISSGEIWRGEIRNKTKDGQFYWVDTFIIPRLTTEGNIHSYYSIRVDITERKNQELEIVRQKEDLEKIANIQSHQVRKPVANIIGLVGLLDDTNLNDNNKELVGLLKESVKELEGTISDIVKKAE